ncbi:MAG TPA: hypothetical protein VFT45_08900 [Longimicrobium sp.]|nr:hypothetical protein [Longimicrobium sp.]
MSDPMWFDDIPVIGKLSPPEAAAKLREMGDLEAAAQVESPEPMADGTESFGMLGWGKAKHRLYRNTTHTFGFVAISSDTDLLPARHAGQIDPDERLKNNRIKITLDRLRVASYPGGGMHRILFDFYAKNQAEGQDEHLHFTLTLRVQEGQYAGVIGYPIFVGLNVGAAGIDMKGFTVNVKNDADERFLAALESDVFRSGLKLATTVQPAIAPLAGITHALTQTIAKRNRNVPVQDFFMGLDFDVSVPSRARLREGAYIVVQLPESDTVLWNWNEWVFDRSNGQLVRADDHRKMVPYNYLVLGVSQYNE